MRAIVEPRFLSDELNNAASFLDLLLSERADETGANNNRDLRKKALAEDLAVAGSKSVDDRGSRCRGSREVLVALLSRDQRPQLIKVENGAPLAVLQQVELAHTELTEITRMVLVEVSTVVVLATSHTTTTGILSVLANTTVSGRDVTARLPCLGETSRHLSYYNLLGLSSQQ